MKKWCYGLLMAFFFILFSGCGQTGDLTASSQGDTTELNQ